MPPLWLEHLADWADPIVRILAVPTAIITFGITAWRVRKWFLHISIATEQAAAQSVQAAAKARDAATHSAAAAGSIADASSSAKTAADNSRQANEAVLFMAEQVARANTARDVLAEQVDTLFGALAAERARRGERTERPPTTGTALILPPDADHPDPALVTGRHALRTSVIEQIRQEPT